MVSLIIPAELKNHRQWICWQLRERKGKATKIPINPHNGSTASSTEPATWGTFTETHGGCQRYGCTGAGFVFTPADPFCGVDLDHCLDPTTGGLSDLAARIVARLRSYTALSQSGTGLHIIVKGKLPPGRRQGPWGGLYDAGRFFALTGSLWPGSGITVESRQTEIEALHAELFPTPVAPAPPRLTGQYRNLADTEILNRMFAARNGAAVRRLWEGDVSGYQSHSEADLALCALLAFWCQGDAARIDNLFRQSGLMRDKWKDREGYRDKTIEKAREQSAYYDPEYGKSPRKHNAGITGTFPEKSGGRPSHIIVEVA